MPNSEIYHITATANDFSGNGSIGRYVFLPGSDERAQKIASHFSNCTIQKHPRGHHLYLGTLSSSYGDIEVAAISSGMGGPSADIIINELLILGVKRILRIGTAGSLQPHQIRVGDLVIVTAAVRDDKASWDYIYKEYPALSSLEYVVAAQQAANILSLNQSTYCGIVHTKSSLYAREMEFSILSENDSYMKNMRAAGVLATEMECAQLFILTSLLNARLKTTQKMNERQSILSGAILSVIGDETPFSCNDNIIEKSIDSAIQLGIETTKEIFRMDNTH